MKGVNPKNGFSLIEVLVASSIMIMLMLMLGMLFQQTSQAWRTGRQRADVLLKARVFFGIVQRDVSTAIDINTLFTDAQKQRADYPFASYQQSFSSSELKFFTLTGTGFENVDAEKNKAGNPSLRSVTYVQYDDAGRRYETAFLPKADGGFEPFDRPSSAGTMLLGNRLAGAQLENVAFKAYDSSGSPISGQQFPAYITIKANATAQTNTIEIGAASAGPDRAWDTKDDIRTWTE